MSYNFPYQPHNWLIHKLMWDKMNEIASNIYGNILIDLGCGSMPYKKVFEKKVKFYVGIDIRFPENNNSSDYRICGNVAAIPVKDNIADIIVFTEVLEHTDSPLAVLKEIYRVLKPGGWLIMSVPFIWHIHDKPNDFFRFTEYGIQRMLTETNFKIKFITPLTGFTGTFLQLMCYFIWNKLTRRKILVPVAKSTVWLIQRTGYLLNKIDTSFEFTSVYFALAQKQ